MLVGFVNVMLRKVALAGIFAGLMSAAALAENAPHDPAFSNLFARVLANPGNADLGLEYASSALKRGEPRKALSTYERILLQDPGNVAALAGLVRVRLLIAPPFTSWRAEAGVGVASNARHVASGKSSGVKGRGALGMRDERRLGDRRWRTLGTVRYDHFADVDDLMAGLATLSTGPMLASGPLLEDLGAFVFRPAVGVSYSWLDGRTLYFEAFGEASAESFSKGVLSSVSLRAGHRNVSNFYSTRDGWIVDFKARRGQQGLFMDTDVFTAAARLRYSDGIGADTKDVDPSTPLFPGDYVEARGKFAYSMPLVGDVVSGGPTLTAFARRYRTPVSTGTAKDRRDVYIAPGATVSFDDICGRQCDVKFHYRYENNSSNDSARDYINHAGGVRLAVSF